MASWWLELLRWLRVEVLGGSSGGLAMPEGVTVTPVFAYFLSAFKVRAFIHLRSQKA